MVFEMIIFKGRGICDLVRNLLFFTDCTETNCTRIRRHGSFMDTADVDQMFTSAVDQMLRCKTSALLIVTLHLRCSIFKITLDRDQRHI